MSEKQQHDKLPYDWEDICPGLTIFEYEDQTFSLWIEEKEVHTYSAGEMNALAAHAPAVKALVEAAQEVVSWELKDTHGFKELRAALEPFTQGQDDSEAELAAA
jgi:hypothetical protein